jgi:hypothetical protein
MILKFIETNEAPKVRDLVKLKSGKLVLAQTSNDGFIGWYIYLGVKGGILHVHFKEDDKVVLPYGISNEKIKVGDKVVDTTNCKIHDVNNEASINYLNGSWHFEKIVIQPNQFNYHQIVDLGLKDGSNFDVDTYSINKSKMLIVDSNNKVTIAKQLLPIIAKIEHINDLGKSEWYEVVYYDNGWYSYAGSKTFQDGEKVVEWKYCKDCL